MKNFKPQQHNEQEEHKTTVSKSNTRPLKSRGTQDHNEHEKHQDHNKRIMIEKNIRRQHNN
jgi:hypothetical protein